MRFFSATALVIIALAIPSVAKAGSISFDAGQPTSPAAGKVSATGTYSTATNEMLFDIVLIAMKVGGGQGGQVTCTASGGNWNGTINNLPAGKYNVFARLRVSVTGMGMFAYDTAAVEVTVN